MNSKLHSTVILVAASGVLLLGWIATVPAASFSVTAPSLAVAAQAPPASMDRAQGRSQLDPAISARVDAVAQQIVAGASRSAGLGDGATTQTGATRKSHSETSRRMRRSMAMPFFSFAPRG